MLKNIFLATTNNGKITEIKNKLNFLDLNFITKKDYPDIVEPIENGNTFYENALIKAKYYYDKTQLPSLADDSGLVVEALNNEPGVYSARYAGDNSTDYDNNQKLLKALQNIKNRKAYFYCSLVFYNSENLIISAEGRVEGFIIDNPRGDNGFGYDPIFYIETLNKTMAELTTDEKNRISHRANALNLLFEKINKLFN